MILHGTYQEHSIGARRLIQAREARVKRYMHKATDVEIVGGPLDGSIYQGAPDCPGLPPPQRGDG